MNTCRRVCLFVITNNHATINNIKNDAECWCVCATAVSLCLQGGSGPFSTQWGQLTMGTTSSEDSEQRGRRTRQKQNGKEDEWRGGWTVGTTNDEQDERWGRWTMGMMNNERWGRWTTGMSRTTNNGEDERQGWQMMRMRHGEWARTKLGHRSGPRWVFVYSTPYFCSN
jgi:hypothetical protein